MTSRIGARGRVVAFALLAGTVLGAAPSAFAVDMYPAGPVAKAPVARVPQPLPPQQGGGWFQGCTNCMPPGASPGGPGVGLGIANAPVAVGAVPPPIYYGQPPRVYLYPVPEVYVQGPVAPLYPPPAVNPRSCWVANGPGGGGYWVSPC
ncbi:hypothetical protein V5F53_10470 [Xanthobacter sp. V4C-4]|uniref:hypothetical protein n=1 Tax=Xanthobacter cornucopiae TaxID=3119924 RepID=UPI003727E38F